MDTRPKKIKMATNWFKPFTRVPDSLYLRVAKACAAKAVGTDDKRPPQTYYFDGVNVKDPNAPTVDGLVERIMCRKAVKNMIRFLMVRRCRNHRVLCRIFLG